MRAWRACVCACVRSVRACVRVRVWGVFVFVAGAVAVARAEEEEDCFGAVRRPVGAEVVARTRSSCSHSGAVTVAVAVAGGRESQLEWEAVDLEVDVTCADQRQFPECTFNFLSFVQVQLTERAPVIGSSAGNQLACSNCTLECDPRAGVCAAGVRVRACGR